MKNFNNSKTENIVEQKQNIRFDPENPKQLYLEYYDQICNVAEMTIWVGISFAIVSIIALLLSISNTSGANFLLNTLFYNGFGENKWDIITLILDRGILLCLCIRAYNLLIYRKKNAIFITRFILWVCLLSLLLNWGINFYYNQIFQILRVFNVWSVVFLIWCIFGLFRTAYSKDFKQAFPKNYRSHSALDVVLVLSYLVIPFICTFIGLSNQ